MFKRYTKIFSYVIILLSILMHSNVYSIEKVSEEAMVSYLEELCREQSRVEKIDKSISIKFVDDLGVYAYASSGTIFFPKLYKNLVRGVLEKKRKIVTSFYDQNYKITVSIPHECAILFIKNTLFHEMSHINHPYFFLNKETEINADEDASRSLSASLGGVIGHRLLNMILVKGAKENLQKGIQLHAALSIAATHPSYYEREQFFRKRVESLLLKNPRLQHKLQKIFELGNQIQVKMKNVSTGENYRFTQILKDDA